MKGKKGNGRQDKPVQKTREEIRKEKRKQKKINGALHYARKSKTPGKFVLNPELLNVKNKSEPRNEKKLLEGVSDSDVEEVFEMVPGSKKKTMIPDANDSLDEMASNGEESLGEESNRKRKRMKKDESAKKSTKKRANIAKKFNKDSIDRSDMNKNDFSDLNTYEDDGEDANDDLTDSKENKSKSKNANGTREDIFGRKRDKDGNIMTLEGNKCIPPAARRQQLENDSARRKKSSCLKKKYKGPSEKTVAKMVHRVHRFFKGPPFDPVTSYYDSQAGLTPKLKHSAGFALSTLTMIIHALNWTEYTGEEELDPLYLMKCLRMMRSLLSRSLQTCDETAAS